MLQRVVACCSVLQHALSRRSLTHIGTMCRAVEFLKSHLATQLTTEIDCRADCSEFLRDVPANCFVERERGSERDRARERHREI